MKVGPMALSVAAMRPFGSVQDLEIDFTDEDRPTLVTALLASCGEASDAEFWWAQPVGGRIAALLRMLALTEGDSGALSVTLRLHAAPSAAHRSRSRFPMTRCNLPRRAAMSTRRDPWWYRCPGGDRQRVRRPTGSDLRTWRRTPYASRHEAVAAMLDALVVEGGVVPDDETVVADAMATHDPLVAFTVSCACPACGAERDRPVDLEAIALARLSALQRTLLREIHVLASKYGWTESEVLAIAPARRARYLRLIEDGL